jgi:hypothetical protein
VNRTEFLNSNDGQFIVIALIGSVEVVIKVRLNLRGTDGACQERDNSGLARQERDNLSLACQERDNSLMPMN